MNIFGRKEKIWEKYAPQEEKVYITKETNGKKTVQILEKKGRVDNIYGFIYRYRLYGNFKIGEIMDIRLPTKDLKIALRKRVHCVAGGKKYDSFYMEIRPSQYKIWFDSGAKKLPLRISGAIGLTNTSMIMTGHEE